MSLLLIIQHPVCVSSSQLHWLYLNAIQDIFYMKLLKQSLMWSCFTDLKPLEILSVNSSLPLSKIAFFVFVFFFSKIKQCFSGSEVSVSVNSMLNPSSTGIAALTKDGGVA